MSSSSRRTGPWARVLLSTLYLLVTAQAASAAIAVPPPKNPPADDANVVYSNFLGLSLELSFINYYFGNSTEQMPQPVLKYLSTLHAHGSGKPVRIRLGGNSMDSSTYVPGQPDAIEFTDPNANWNDQPVNYGPQLFETMKGVSSAVGGTEYLIGESTQGMRDIHAARSSVWVAFAPIAHRRSQVGSLDNKQHGGC